jgi:uncharacterized protein YbjT (DUF2867 family)
MITGANGFLGQSILSSLSDDYQIKALCRSMPKQENQKSEKEVKWVQCDLFNLKQTEEALQGVDVLLYLVHSMTKGNRFSQSQFEDLDLIIADNVARAAKKNHLKQIIFVTGIIPDEVKSLSRHLKSRQEVETVLDLSGVPTTCIRSGIIIGAGGSSFQIVYRLVKKLKVMATPKWTQSKSQPIDVRDVVTLALKAIGNAEFFNQKIDVHGSETLSYNDLMKKFASIMHVKRLFVNIPFFNLSISKLWLQLISGMDYDLVSPLVDSLKHDLPAKKSDLFEKYIPNPIPLSESIQYWIAIEEKRGHRQKSKQEFEKDVRSVQRLSLPKGWNAVDLAKEYVNWLPRMFVSGNMIHFDLFGLKLLSLLFSEDRSTPDRQLFYIVGGLLVSPNLSANARLEFRICPHENSALVAIHDYRPSLPWYLYRLFQANIHYFVMFLFGRHLEKVILLNKS